MVAEPLSTPEFSIPVVSINQAKAAPISAVVDTMQIDGIVDEEWYLSQYPDVVNAIKSGHFRSAEHHYIAYGIREGRLPKKPIVDEAWYLRTYPDVAVAVRDGVVKSG